MQPRSLNLRVLPAALACLVAATVAMTAGCSIAGREPVPKSLLSCREFSQRGNSALERGDYGSAETLLSQAVTAWPADIEARRRYAEALWKRGSREQAIRQLQEAVRIANDDPALLVVLADYQLGVGDAVAAKANVEAALDLYPQCSAGWALHGKLLDQSGHLQEALADYHRALAQDPTNRDLLLSVAELYRRIDEPQRALTNLAALSDTYPSGEEPQNVLYLQGLALVALDRPDDAARTLSLASTRGTASAEVLYALARAQLAAGHRPEACVALSQSLAVNPQYAASRELIDQLELAQANGSGLPR